MRVVGDIRVVGVVGLWGGGGGFRVVRVVGDARVVSNQLPA